MWSHSSSDSKFVSLRTSDQWMRDFVSCILWLFITQQVMSVHIPDLTTSQSVHRLLKPLKTVVSWLKTNTVLSRMQLILIHRPTQCQQPAASLTFIVLVILLFFSLVKYKQLTVHSVQPAWRGGSKQNRNIICSCYWQHPINCHPRREASVRIPYLTATHQIFDISFTEFGFLHQTDLARGSRPPCTLCI